MQMVIGNQNYSSWSMRPWLLLKQLEIEFKERKIYFGTREAEDVYSELPSNHKVPVLIDGELYIWESLAICEYAAEKVNKPIWPASATERARARSICYEMATSFFALRKELPLNVRREPKPVEITDGCRSDIRRIDRLWSGYQGERYLFGGYSLVDAFFTPVASRFYSYAIDTLSKSSKQYMAKLLSNTVYKEWQAAALLETHQWQPSER